MLLMELKGKTIMINVITSQDLSKPGMVKLITTFNGKVLKVKTQTVSKTLADQYLRESIN